MGNATILGRLVSSTTKLPYFSSYVAAGFPSPAVDHVEQKVSLDELLCINAPHTYLVRALGDSMIGAGIYDRDIMVVSRGVKAVLGDVVIAIVNGDSCVKRLTKVGEGYVLCSENAKYSPIHILEGDELLVWGVVTDSIHRQRAHG